MSSQHNDLTDESTEERDASMPMLRTWWTELSPAGKVLIPTTAAVLLVVTVSAVPPLVF